MVPIAHTGLPFSRSQPWARVSTELAFLDDARLYELFEANPAPNGWGKNHVLAFETDKTFVKRVPLTAVEVANPFSTKNHFNLPTYYNYGVGSAGFGAWRELVANLKMTAAVASSTETSSFPLLYGFRVCRKPGVTAAPDMAWLDKYVAYWGSNENIREYMVARALAEHELVLFFEYVPFVLIDWLKKKPSDTQRLLSRLLEACRFMRKQGMIHFDVHFNNVLTDGQDVYVTDFGLALDRRFDLSDEELTFFGEHTEYDFGEAIGCLGSYLGDIVNLDDLYATIATPEGATDVDKLETLIQSLDTMRGFGGPLHPNLKHALLRHGPVIMLMCRFFRQLQASQEKSTSFPGRELVERLVASGIEL